ncbi:MAG: PhzF family phenazine biosynthesis protein [Sphingomonadaceae bacterium]|nr:PhzF family phenazine biosynthesis protein [Sphingomonadaceae bacterium]
MRIAYWHIDAFAARPFGGNQAAVMLLDRWLADDVLASIAAENCFPATAFLVRDTSGEADWEVRWFTPANEIALCGHATLASGHLVLTHPDLMPGADHASFRSCRSGMIEVRRGDPGYELALPAIPTEPGEWPEAVALLGAQPQEVWLSPSRYGIYLFESEDQLRALAPDLRGLGVLGNDQFICTAPGTRTDVVSRVFVPGGGVDEDSVTGSAHAALTPFWTARLGQTGFTAHQASARGGDLTCRLENDRVWLGGACVTMVEGSFYLTG